MKVYRHLLPVAALLALPAAVRAQNELNNFTATGRGGVINTFATDYQVIGINPANLGRDGGAVVAFSLAEVGVGAASRSLSKTLFKHILFDSGQAIGPAEKKELLNGLEGENALNFNLDATTVAVSVRLPSGLGGLAFSQRQRIGAHLALNRNAADFIVNGKNAASVQPYYPSTIGSTGTLPPPPLSFFLDGTAIQMAWTSEFNLAYGVQVVSKTGFKASVGAGYRYIEGLGVADIRVEGGNLSAYSALSPLFNLDYAALATNPQFNYETGSGLQPVGRGHGFDAGVAVEVGKALRLGASVTDLGTMTWTGNVLTASDQKLQAPQSNGIETYNVLKELVEQFDTKGNNLFTYQAAQQRTASLPGKVRLGAGYRISALFEAGVDFTMPLNKVAGNLTSPFLGLGLDFKPVRWIRLSSGISGGSGYGTSLPLGFAVVTPIWEAGISSRDVLGYTNETSPYYSVGLGFLRFKIGAKN